MGISCYKREKTPKYTEQQALKAKDYCAKLSNLLYRTSCFVVMDDEKYFTFNSSTEKCSDYARFVGKEKYPKKVFVLLAFSSNGILVPSFRSSTTEAIKSSIYVKECLVKRLLPFIHKYNYENYIFWPDLASAHYSNETVS